MSKSFRIRRGANIKLEGEAEQTTTAASFATSFALKPSDFHGMTPKMLIKEGAKVKAGTPIFYDKSNERIKYVSPVSGELTAIVRGARRAILEIQIAPDRDQSFEQYNTGDLAQLTGDQVKALLLDAGLWPLIKQRPYDVVADPMKTPKGIFISGFDSAPLAPSYDYILKDSLGSFQKGVDALSKMTKGKVHLSLCDSNSPLSKVKNAEISYFNALHPAGNVGIQIHHIDPINKGEVAWTLSAQSVAMIGRFFETSQVSFAKTIAIVGSEVKKPRYVKTIAGASIQSIVDGELSAADNRIISGNVLTGQKLSPQGYIGFYDDIVTVIPEGRNPQFMGWLAPNFHKFSISHSYFSWLMPAKKYRLNTNQNGEDRAYVVSGQYEDVLPMDIYPVHLIKSIMASDIERMENLGIYEIAPEDFALCEFACTSKIEVQKIVREGLDLAMKELG